MSMTTITTSKQYLTIITYIAVTNTSIQLIDHCIEKTERRSVPLYEHLITLVDQIDKRNPLIIHHLNYQILLYITSSTYTEILI